MIGFEPNPDALSRLNKKKGRNETYLPHALYDGGRHTFHVCKAEGMSSILRPNPEILDCIQGFSEWETVVSEFEIDTVRLDDVTEITDLDYLKIDTQGSELTIFQNGTEKLSDCMVIHAEVEFLPMYVDQPLFSDVETFLRGLGFILHRFSPLSSRALKPLVFNNNLYAPFSQVIWADAIFVRDFTKLENLSPGKLLKLAVILHDVYRSYDLAVRVLQAHDRKVGASFAEKFLNVLGLSTARG